MELIEWYKKQPKGDKAIWIFIVFSIIYFAIEILRAFNF